MRNKTHVQQDKNETDMDVIRINHLSEVDPALWNSVVPKDRIICSYEHLRAVEESGINDCDYRYLMIYIKGKLIAHTCFYYISFDLDIFNSGKSKIIFDFIKTKIYPDFLRIKTIECGSPTALGNTITITHGINRETVVKLIIKEMEYFAREKKVKILIMRDFFDEELFFFDRLKRLGFKRLNLLPDPEIINNWETFDHYLNDMRSKYRYRLNNYIKIFNTSSVRVEVRDHFSDIAERLTELWHQSYEHAKEYKREILTPSYFRNMDHYLNGRSKVILFIYEEQIIGFGFVLLDDETLRSVFMGMDQKYNRISRLYFNILIETIKFGIKNKKKQIEWGITSTRSKLDMGADLLPLYAYMKHLSPFLNKIIPNLFMLFSPPPKRESKHVFNMRYFERIFANLTIKYLYNGKVLEAIVKNISESGVYIQTKSILKKNSIITIEFSSPDKKESFIAMAKIVWIKKVKKNRHAGCEYIAMNKKTEEKIRNIIKELKAREIIK
ncbi:MAG: GNAT family N-acetyltransferase [Spirochaetales bacterium]|nr:GNAT family N-acetyltransferase [Spirochaetales bacterium]